MSKQAGLTWAQGAGLAAAAAVVAAVGLSMAGVFSSTPETEPGAGMVAPAGDVKTTSLEITKRDEPAPVAEPETEVILPGPGSLRETQQTDETTSGSAPVQETDKPAAETLAAPAPTKPVSTNLTDQLTGADPEHHAPAFDLVRVEPGGSAMIAGRAAPGTDVVIELDGAEIGRALAGVDGSFAQIVEITPADRPQMIRLKVEQEGRHALYSAQEAIVAQMPTRTARATEPQKTAPTKVPKAIEDQGADRNSDTTSSEVAQKPRTDGQMAGGPSPVPEAVSDTGQEREQGDIAAVSSARDESKQPLAPASDALVNADPPKSPAVLLSDKKGVRVLQPAEPEHAPEVMGAVALDTISYSETGEVLLAGRGQSSGFVRVYIDNRPVTTSRIAADGQWRTGLPEVDTGVYTLRVDEIGADGTVKSRVETPFKREEQEVLAEAGKVTAITVQPGNTLWAIARDSYGEGTLYVRLFEANRDRIRNPDLIYPGQVFDIPRE